MVATPILFAGVRSGSDPAAEARAARPNTTRSTPSPTPVIICGFGRFGQIIGRVLRMHGIEFTALERDPGPGRGGPPLRHQGVFRRPDAAGRAARGRRRAGEAAGRGAGRSAGVLRTVEVAKRNFPNLAILARARNRWYAHLLMDRDVDGLVRETFHSSLELAETGADPARHRRGGRRTRGHAVPRPRREERCWRPTRSIATSSSSSRASSRRPMNWPACSRRIGRDRTRSARLRHHQPQHQRCQRADQAPATTNASGIAGDIGDPATERRAERRRRD